MQTAPHALCDPAESGTRENGIHHGSTDRDPARPSPFYEQHMEPAQSPGQGVRHTTQGLRQDLIPSASFKKIKMRKGGVKSRRVKLKRVKFRRVKLRHPGLVWLAVASKSQPAVLE